MMKRDAYSLCVGISALAWAVSLQSQSARADEKAAETIIKIEDVADGRAAIIGILGHPLREKVALRGEWVESEGPVIVGMPNIQLRVTFVNGKAPATRIDIPFSNFMSCGSGTKSQTKEDLWDWRATAGGNDPSPTFLAGETWDFEAAETLSMQPDLRELEAPEGTRFRSPLVQVSFCYYRARRVTDPVNNPPSAKPSPVPHALETAKDQLSSPASSLMDRSSMTLPQSAALPLAPGMLPIPLPSGVIGRPILGKPAPQTPAGPPSIGDPPPNNGGAPSVVFPPNRPVGEVPPPKLLPALPPKETPTTAPPPA